MSIRLRIAVLLFLLPIVFSTPSLAGIRFGGVVFGAGYSHSWGPAYGYPDYGFFGPWGYGYPWYAPFYLEPAGDRGTVRLKKVDNAASVFINDAYAGLAKDLKTIYLDPGAYNLEIRSPGQPHVQKRIYVLSRKTLTLEF